MKCRDVARGTAFQARSDSTNIGPAREALGTALRKAGDFSRADYAAYVKALFKRGWVGGPLSIDELF